MGIGEHNVFLCRWSVRYKNFVKLCQCDIPAAGADAAHLFLPNFG